MLTVAVFLGALHAVAQPPPPPPPGDLDRLVDRIALYPDPLLSDVLAASTYPDQIPEAAHWADDHAYLRGEDLARAISYDRLWFDPSVQALLPFPAVLDMMAGDMGWTQALGDAVLNDRPGVMDAVQRLRHRAYDSGYLRSNPQVIVRVIGSYIEILPAHPGYIYVPRYDPAIVFLPPRPGVRVAATITFGPAIFVGVGFGPWGWGGANRIIWDQRVIVLDNRPWIRTRENRATYVHPYPMPRYERRPYHPEEHRGHPHDRGREHGGR
jgi:hypothetical protein